MKRIFTLACFLVFYSTSAFGDFGIDCNGCTTTRDECNDFGEWCDTCVDGSQEYCPPEDYQFQTNCKVTHDRPYDPPDSHIVGGMGALPDGVACSIWSYGDTPSNSDDGFVWGVCQGGVCLPDAKPSPPPSSDLDAAKDQASQKIEQVDDSKRVTCSGQASITSFSGAGPAVLPGEFLPLEVRTLAKAGEACKLTYIWERKPFNSSIFTQLKSESGEMYRSGVGISRYIIDGATTSHEGVYRVRIRTSSGSEAISPETTVKLASNATNSTFTISSQPVSTSTCVNESVVFTVETISTEALIYQWFVQPVKSSLWYEIPPTESSSSGQQTEILLINPTDRIKFNGAKLRVRVSSKDKTQLSDIAGLEVLDCTRTPPSTPSGTLEIVSQPYEYLVNNGDPLLVDVRLRGLSGAEVYDWEVKSGAFISEIFRPLSGTATVLMNKSKIFFTKVGPGYAGTYRLTVKRGDEEVTSEDIRIRVQTAPGVVIGPSLDSDIPSLPPSNDEDTLKLIRTAINKWRTDLSAVPDPAALPTITQQPVASLVLADTNSSLSLSVRATAAAGGGPLTYQWQFKPYLSGVFNDLAGKTSVDLQKSPVSISDVGVYRVIIRDTKSGAMVISNESAVTASARLMRNAGPPVAANKIPDIGVKVGSKVVFTPLLVGERPFTVSYSVSGVPVAASGIQLIVTMSAGTKKTYSFAASNSKGTFQSETARFEAVEDPQAILALAGQQINLSSTTQFAPITFEFGTLRPRQILLSLAVTNISSQPLLIDITSNRLYYKIGEGVLGTTSPALGSVAPAGTEEIQIYLPDGFFSQGLVGTYTVQEKIRIAGIEKILPITFVGNLTSSSSTSTTRATTTTSTRPSTTTSINSSSTSTRATTTSISTTLPTTTTSRLTTSVPPTTTIATTSTRPSTTTSTSSSSTSTRATTTTSISTTLPTTSTSSSSTSTRATTTTSRLTTTLPPASTTTSITTTSSTTRPTTVTTTRSTVVTLELSTGTKRVETHTTGRFF